MTYFLEKNGIKFSSDSKFIYAHAGSDKIKLALFDGHFYKLKLYKDVPVLEIDGLRMHLVRDFKSPLDYSKEVVKKLKIKEGLVFDSCMGLGYTAIEASKKAKVITCEISKAVITLAQWNPFSDKLFSDKNIIVMNSSAMDQIKEFKSGMFSAIIHDPPRFSHAPELYSREFYDEMHRVSKKNARIFHYVGSVGKGRGRSIEKEVEARLREAGFRNFEYDKKVQGIYFSK